MHNNEMYALRDFLLPINKTEGFYIQDSEAQDFKYVTTYIFVVKKVNKC